MGSIIIFKPLSTFLKPAPFINLSNIDSFTAEFFLEILGIEPWLVGEKQVCYLCYAAPLNTKKLFFYFGQQFVEESILGLI